MARGWVVGMPVDIREERWMLGCWDARMLVDSRERRRRMGMMGDARMMGCWLIVGKGEGERGVCWGMLGGWDDGMKGSRDAGMLVDRMDGRGSMEMMG